MVFRGHFGHPFRFVGATLFFCHFVSCVIVWATGVKALGSAPPACGILPQMCVLVNALRVTHLHILQQLTPSVGIEPGAIALKSRRVTRWEARQFERPEIGYPYPRLWGRKRHRLIPNDWAGDHGEIAANPPPIWGPSFWTLIAA